MIIKKGIYLILLLFVSQFFSCGHYASRDDYSILPNKGLQKPITDKAVVYVFYVEKKYSSSLIVYRDQTPIGILAGGTYFYEIVEPGKYIYWLDPGLVEKSRGRVELVVQAGKIYYLRFTPGGYYVVSKFDLSSEDIATAFINGLDYIEIKKR